MTKKRIKKILIGLGIACLVLWFGGNLAHYMFLRHTLKRAMNTVPEKLQLSESNIASESLLWMNVKLKFPYYREDIYSVVPSFEKHRLVSVWIYLTGHTKRVIELHKITALPMESKRGKMSYISMIRTAKYAVLKDFSWWNTVQNLRLGGWLILKAIIIPSYERYRWYEVETSLIDGFLTEVWTRDGKIIWEFEYELKHHELKDKEYSLLFFGIDEDTALQARSILSSIQPLDNADEGYKDIEAAYGRKKISRYPDELLLLSMISLKGSTLENLEELLRIMQKKNYKPDYIKEVKAEIDFLSNKGKN